MDVPTPGPWQQAVVRDISDENARVKTLRLRLPHPRRHVAGQHCVVRLTAPDGYTAQRSYSIGSAPADGAEIDLTLERVPEGEVSTFLHDELVVGDTLRSGARSVAAHWNGTTRSAHMPQPDTATPDRLMTIAEVADRLGVEVRHMRRLVHERRVPYIKWGHLLRFDPTDIETWIDANRRPVSGRIRR